MSYFLRVTMLAFLALGFLFRCPEDSQAHPLVSGTVCSPSFACLWAIHLTSLPGVPQRGGFSCLPLASQIQEVSLTY